MVFTATKALATCRLPTFGGHLKTLPLGLGGKLTPHLALDLQFDLTRTDRLILFSCL